MVLGGAAQSLLGADVSGYSNSQRDGETGDKRTKLRRYEHVGPQVLNVLVSVLSMSARTKLCGVPL